MMRVLSAVMNVLAAGGGAAVTLLGVSLIDMNDPALTAAQRRFAALSPDEAYRVQVTWDLLKKSPEYDRIKHLHRTIENDPALKQQFFEFADWWSGLTESERDEILDVPNDQWVQAVHSAMTSEAEPSIRIVLTPDLPRQKQQRQRTITVPLKQIDAFLEAAMPSDLSEKDARLLRRVDPDDLRMARTLIIAGSLLRPLQMPGSRMNGDIRKAVSRVFSALRPILITRWDRPPRDFPDPMQMAVCFQVLNQIRIYESSRRRSSDRIDRAVETRFEQMVPSARRDYMLSAPRDALADLRSEIRAQAAGSPDAELARRELEFRKLAENLQRRLQNRERRAPRGPGRIPRPAP